MEQYHMEGKKIKWQKEFCFIAFTIMLQFYFLVKIFCSQRFRGAQNFWVNAIAMKSHLFSLISYYSQSPWNISISAMNSPKVAKWLDHCALLLTKKKKSVSNDNFYAFSEEIDLFTSKLFVINKMMKSWNFNQPFVLCKSHYKQHSGCSEFCWRNSLWLHAIVIPIVKLIYLAVAFI